jgi:ipoprotein LpqH
MTDANPPEVRSIFLNVADPEGLSYLQGFYNNTAQATKDGKSYKISGTASGGMGKPARPFEIDATCP